MDTLDDLVNILKIEIPKAESIAGLTGLISQYKGNDWEDYIKFDENGYNRGKVYSNDEFDLLVVSWMYGQSAPPHDHPDRGCIMKVLMGSLEEKLYRPKEDGELSVVAIAQRNYGEVGYIDNARGYHSITNTGARTGAVSLHLYSPGNYSPSYLLG